MQLSEQEIKRLAGKINIKYLAYQEVSRDLKEELLQISEALLQNKSINFSHDTYAGVMGEGLHYLSYRVGLCENPLPDDTEQYQIKNVLKDYPQALI
jgi:hypothetical protein